MLGARRGGRREREPALALLRSSEPALGNGTASGGTTAQLDNSRRSARGSSPPARRGVRRAVAIGERRAMAIENAVPHSGAIPGQQNRAGQLGSHNESLRWQQPKIGRFRVVATAGREAWCGRGCGYGVRAVQSFNPWMGFCVAKGWRRWQRRSAMKAVANAGKVASGGLWGSMGVTFKPRVRFCFENLRFCFRAKPFVAWPLY
jgi:hypothetical protein